MASSFRRNVLPLLLPAAALAAASAANAEDARAEPARTRVALGPQLVPAYPGADDFKLRPLIDVASARGDETFDFEAADESFGFSVLDMGRLSVGPVLNFEGSRTPAKVGAAVPKVAFSFEAGGFAEYRLAENFRLRGELRKALTGHDGLVGTVGGDFVTRDRDDWLFSIGPRLNWGNNRFHDAYFSVAPADAAAAGLPAYDAGGGIYSAGAAAGFIKQLTPRWGVYSYAKYERLVGDAARSPIVLQQGSRNQFSGGAALTYTFGSGVR